MDTSISGTLLRLAGLLTDMALRMMALLVCGVLLVTVAIVDAALLVPALGVLACLALLWRPTQHLLQRLGVGAAPSATLLERQVQILADQVALLEQEQTRLRALVRWQAEMLDRLVHEERVASRR
jgi:hypothetical protein